MPRSPSVPSYRLHKPTGQAVVTVRTAGGNRRDIYLGTFNSPESRAEYARIVAELATGPVPGVKGCALTGAPVADQLTVDQLLLVFLQHAQQHYRTTSGKQTDEVREIKRSVLHLHTLYGKTQAAAFGPRGLATVRQAMIDAGWCRTLINRRIDRIKRAFKWGASQELVSVTVYQALRTLTGLYRGRTAARESAAVKPVELAHVTATLPRLSAHLRALAEIQLFTGMRPGEACALRLAEVDRTGPVWLYRPEHHKTAHHGQERVIAIGPRAQAGLAAFLLRTGRPPVGFAPLQAGDATARLVLADAYQEAGRERDAKVLRDLSKRVEFLEGCVVDPDAPLFSPSEAREERRCERRANRRSKVQPSQADRRKAAPKLVPASSYTTHTYTSAVRKAAAKARVPHWHPNQLRHTFATEVRKAHGLEAAQVLLGHARADVTQVYAEKNLALAVKVAGEMG